MSKFFYRAIKDKKEVVSGYIEANSQDEAQTKIKQMGFLPAGIYEEHKIPHNLKKAASTPIKRLGLKELMYFTSEFQMLIDSGISVFEALDSIANHAPSLKISIFARDLLKKTKSGKTLSEAMEDYSGVLGKVYIALTNTGEESGTLGATQKYLAKLLKKRDELNAKMIHILIYPTILTTIMVGMFFLFGAIIFPYFIQQMSLSPADIPITAKIITKSADFIIRYGIIFALAACGICYTTGLSIGFDKIKKNIMEFMMKIPVLKDCLIYITLSHYMSVLHVAYEAGVPIAKTLSLAESTISIDSLKQQANTVTKSIQNGESLTEAFDKTYLLPSVMMSMISTGEKTGKLGQMFNDIARNIEEKLDSAITALSKVFEPVLLVVLGIGVCVMGSAIIQMIYSAINAAF